jgi:hypothetical protein
MCPRCVIPLDHPCSTHQFLANKGSVPSVDEIFPPRPPPIKRGPPDDVPIRTVPIATGVGFFTPDLGNSRNLFPTWKNDTQLPPGLRMGPPLNHRENLYVKNGCYYAVQLLIIHLLIRYPNHPPNSAEVNVQGTRPSRHQSQNQLPAAPASRPLSSADEAGPVAKRLRSTARYRGLELGAKLSKLNTEDALKKVCTMLALSTDPCSSNPFSAYLKNGCQQDQQTAAKCRNRPTSAEYEAAIWAQFEAGSGYQSEHCIVYMSPLH